MTAADWCLHLGSGGTLSTGSGGLACLHLHVVFVDVLSGFHHTLGEVETPTSDSGLLCFGRPPIDESADDGDVSDDAFLPEAFLVFLLKV